MEWFWLIACFVLLAYTIEAMTGFGSIVIALSLGALFVPVESLMPVLVALNILMTGWLSWRLRRHINSHLLCRTILPWMLLGTGTGYLLLPLLDAELAKRLLGVLVLWFAGRELWRSLRHRHVNRHPIWLTRPLIFGAGITHGLFASGGPLLVYALTGKPVDKARFRATLVSVWFLLNIGLTLAFLTDGRLVPALPHAALLAPLLPVGIWLGEHLHHKVDEIMFRRAVYVLLLVAGAALLL